MTMMDVDYLNEECDRLRTERDKAIRALQIERGKLESADAAHDAVARELAAYKQAIAEGFFGTAIAASARELMAANAGNNLPPHRGGQVD